MLFVCQISEGGTNCDLGWLGLAAKEAGLGRSLQSADTKLHLLERRERGALPFVCQVSIKQVWTISSRRQIWSGKMCKWLEFIVCRPQGGRTNPSAGTIAFHEVDCERVSKEICLRCHRI